jgi:hypothetical protein
MQTIKALEKTDLEWTQFQNGYFMDYYGMPYVESNLKPLTFVLDIAHKAASIPGTGNETMTFTYTKDLAKFVVAALDLQNWTYPMVCYSDKSTWNKAVKLAEEYRGVFGIVWCNRFELMMTGTKFKIVYDSVEKLRSGDITELPAHTSAYSFIPKSLLYGIQSKFGLYVAYGMFDLPEERSLNQQFPEIKTTTLEDVIGHWKGQ